MKCHEGSYSSTPTAPSSNVSIRLRNFCEGANGRRHEAATKKKWRQKAKLKPKEKPGEAVRFTQVTLTYLISLGVNI